MTLFVHIRNPTFLTKAIGSLSFSSTILTKLLSNNFKIFEFVNHPSDVIFQSVSDQSKVNTRVFMEYFQILCYHCLFCGSSAGNKVDI